MREMPNASNAALSRINWLLSEIASVPLIVSSAINEEIRKILDIQEKDSLGISFENNGIFIKKETPYCVFCNSISDLKFFNNKHICTNCIKKLK